jgi:excisionase family DNA binding protein
VVLEEWFGWAISDIWDIGQPVPMGTPGSTPPPAPEPLLTPSEVAAMFRVDPKTVTRWAKAGKLSAVRTLGGHRRFRESEVLALPEGEQAGEPAAEATPDGGPSRPGAAAPRGKAGRTYRGAPGSEPSGPPVTAH